MLAAGCSAPVVEVALPDVPGTRALLVGVRYEQRLEVYAVDPEASPDTWTLPLIPALRSDAVMFAMMYSEHLQSLEWAPGHLLQDPQGDLPPRPDGGRFELTITNGQPGAWSAVDEPSSELAFRLAARAPDLSHCRVLDTTVRTLGPPGRVLAAFPEPEGGVLAINISGDAFRITEATIEPLGPTGVDVVFGGTRTATGTIWLSGYAGDLWSGTLETGFRRRPHPPHQDTIRWMVAPPTSNTPAELFTLSRDGVLARLADGAWRSTNLALSNGSDHQGDLTWLGPDAVAAVSPLTGVLSLVSSGVSTDIDVRGTRGTLWDAALLNGTLYGLTDLGLVVRFVGEEFTEQAFIEDAALSNTLTPIADGLLVAARGLRLFHLILGKPPCPVTVPQDLDHEIWTTVVSDGAAYLFTGHPGDWDSESARVVVVRAR